MKSIILYGTRIKILLSHKLICRNPVYYVRVEFSDLDVEEALSKAKPKEGEVVLNSVEICPSE